MSILSELLFCRAGDFYHELFEAGKLSPAYSYECSTLDGHSPLAYHAVVGEADDPAYVFNFYTEYVSRVKERGLTREDFERIRRVLYAGFVAQFDYPDDIAELLCEAEGDGRRLFDALDAIGSITFEEVEALLLQSFDPNLTVFSTMIPDRKTKEEQ
jgi:predicted Zn-dependent peptidase